MVKPTDPSVTPTCSSCTEPCVAAAQPTHQKVAGPYPCLFLAALLCGEGTWLFSALPCGGSGLGRGRPRAPPVGHGLHIRPRRNLTLGLHSNRGRCQLPRGTPLGTATLGGEGCSPLVSRAPYGARCHVALFPSSFLFRYEGAVGSIGVKWRIALHLAPLSVWPHPSAPRQRT